MFEKHDLKNTYSKIDNIRILKNDDINFIPDKSLTDGINYSSISKESKIRVLIVYDHEEDEGVFVSAVFSVPPDFTPEDEEKSSSPFYLSTELLLIIGVIVAVVIVAVISNKLGKKENYIKI